MISGIAMRIRLLGAVTGCLALCVACTAPVPESFEFYPRPKETKGAPDGNNDGGGIPMPDDPEDQNAPPSESDAGGDAGMPKGDGGDAGTDSAPMTPTSCTDADLIACFPLDGDVNDYSSSRLATTANGVSFRPGHRGSAAELAAGSSIVIAGTNALDATAVTVEAFVRWTDTDADVMVFNAAGRYAMMIESDGNVRCTTPGDSVDGGDVPKDQWVHIACVFDGDDARVFVGGQKKDDGGADIGSSPGAGGAIGGSFVGAIDEVRVFRGAKSDAEIAALAQR